MAPPTRIPREKWIKEGLRMLSEGGPETVRIEPLAKALGVSRGGFYWHFENRGALLGEMLDTWERAATEETIAQVEREGGDPRARMRRAGALTFSDRLLPIDLAVRDWSRRDAEVAERLRRVDNRRMEFLRSQFREIYDDEGEIEGRAMLAFSLLIGNHFMAADHGDLTRADALELAVRRVLA
jgi:AcrR family transcriptional regulator